MSTGKNDMTTCKEIRQQAIALLDSRTPGWVGNWLEALVGAGAEGSALSEQYRARSAAWSDGFTKKHAREVASLTSDNTREPGETDDSYDTWLAGRFGADVPVFDRGGLGRNVNAERSDQPGDENFSVDESDGWGDDEEYSPLNFHQPSFRQLAGGGTVDPGKVYTPEQIIALYPNGHTPDAPSLHHAAIFGADYAGIAERPARIGPNVG